MVDEALSEGGYYWVEIDGDITVAQWLGSRWFAVGNDGPVLNSCVIVLSDRLEGPDAPR